MYQSYPGGMRDRFNKAMSDGLTGALGGLAAAIIAVAWAVINALAFHAPSTPAPTPTPISAPPATAWASQSTMAPARPYLGANGAGVISAPDGQVTACEPRGDGGVTVDGIHYGVDQSGGPACHQ